MTKRIMIMSLILVAGNLIAGRILVKEDGESGKPNLIKNARLTSLAKEGEKAYIVKKRKNVYSKKTFTINPDKYYVTSVWVKAAGEKPSRALLGVMPLDVKGRLIDHKNITGVKDSFTKLVEPCKKSDTVIKIEDGSSWWKGGVFMIAFDAKADKSDLPNFNLSTNGIKSIEKNDGVYEVTLKRPVGKAYPAGTKVREHRNGGTFIYDKSGKVPTRWVKWQGKPRKGTKFRKTAVAGRLIMVCNYKEGSDQDMLFDNLMIEEVDAPGK